MNEVLFFEHRIVYRSASQRAAECIAVAGRIRRLVAVLTLSIGSYTRYDPHSKRPAVCRRIGVLLRRLAADRA